MIRIIDYGMGNLQSVANAFEAVGGVVGIARTAESLHDASGIVLPGVGAFGDGMRNLREEGFVPFLERAVLGRGVPFLGLCLGMQLLARSSSEHGNHSGLGWIDADVERLPSDVGGASLRIPHVGWNDVRIRLASRLFRGLEGSTAFYFVHSFYLKPEKQDLVSGECTYGTAFAASVEKENIFATQFHPEKSHRDGLAVLANFLTIVEENRG